MTDGDGDWPLKRLMTEVVGSGTKSAEDMTRAQAAEAMRRIFDGDPHPTTLGAFWLANRWKHNTPEELAAFTDEMCERVEYATPDADPVDCGANYDGKGRTAILGVAAGVDPTTPVAMVERATLPDERVVTGTLDTIVDVADAAAVEPPAVTVVGDVVGVRETVARCLGGSDAMAEAPVTTANGVVGVTDSD